MNQTMLTIQTGHSHLRRLMLLRAIAIAAQCVTLALAYRVLAIKLEWLPMLAAIAGLAVLSLITRWRLRSDRPVSNPELFAQLCADVLVLSVLLYYGGGSTNPFISLFLLPLVIAATALPRSYTWAMAGITTGCYTLLMKFYLPLPVSGIHEGMQHAISKDNAFNMHVMGMWMGFIISAAVIAHFVVKMTQAVHSRDETLARVREETLRNERIVALGTQAAGAAHELGTPLSTLAVIIGELKRDNAVLPEWRDNLTILDDQVRACKRILGKLLANSQDTLTPTPQPLQQFLAETLNEWQLLRPSIPCHYSAPDQAGPESVLCIDPSLRAALLNLLNNAADSSPGGIEIQISIDADNFTLKIHDHGQGLTPETAARAGSAFFTTKEEGHGLGLLLANATVERMGGKVQLFNREGGGATTELILPLRPHTT
jgi:two-component system sensor histidine kinase RegB